MFTRGATVGSVTGKKS